MDCVFCKIRDGQVPSFKIHEDARTITFMDINPLNSGHCLVATKAHAATIHEADVEDLKAVMATTKKVAAAIQHALKPDGLNLLQANGAAAFQSVPHFHMHLIPRNHGAGLAIHSRTPGDPQRMAEIAKRLGEAIASS